MKTFYKYVKPIQYVYEAILQIPKINVYKNLVRTKVPGHQNLLRRKNVWVKLEQLWKYLRKSWLFSKQPEHRNIYSFSWNILIHKATLHNVCIHTSRWYLFCILFFSKNYWTCNTTSSAVLLVSPWNATFAVNQIRSCKTLFLIEW